jgi:hypothetical protein
VSSAFPQFDDRRTEDRRPQRYDGWSLTPLDLPTAREVRARADRKPAATDPA